MTQPAHPNMNELREAYKRGENIVQTLAIKHPTLSRDEVIEIAYDLQAGSYTKSAIDNLDQLRTYANEIYSLCKSYLEDHELILDCGTGELTTLSALSNHLPPRSRLLACDISLSRLRVGQLFAKRYMRHDLAKSLELFVADMGRMPLADNSVDVVLTVHSLEPNHGRERELIKELIRIARHRLLLFEPSWENASDAVRARMQQHGYVRDLPRHIEEAGGDVVSVQPLQSSSNPMNPTYCYVVEPVANNTQTSFDRPVFHCPRSGLPLQKQQSYWWSQEGGWAYPHIDGIACLRQKHGVLMSHA